MVNIKRDNVTLQYPEERWPRPERNIGFEHKNYNVIRSRLHVDIDDCIGCLKCERACPVDCIKIDTIKAPTRGEDIPDVKHTGETSNGTKKAMVVSRFTIDMSECCYCNLCTYPCPEECIFMVGGPNSSKHPIDYEFSEFDRTDLIYQFAKKLSTEEKENLQKTLPEAKA
jgi:NADH-quinone oxidoreductase subunit I